MGTSYHNPSDSAGPISSTTKQDQKENKDEDKNVQLQQIQASVQGIQQELLN